MPGRAESPVCRADRPEALTLPLMPKATAVWLIEKTGLTFTQIADFCGMHPLEVQAIADGEVAQGIVGYDPGRQQPADVGGNPPLRGGPRRAAEADAVDDPAAEAAARARAIRRWRSAPTGRTASPTCCAIIRSSTRCRSPS